jgi:hypothetical protein
MEDECPICLESLLSPPAPQMSALSHVLGEEMTRDILLETPCGGLLNGDGSSVKVVSKEQGRHAFHALCLCCWLQKSCRCPLCKADLRKYVK